MSFQSLLGSFFWRLQVGWGWGGSLTVMDVAALNGHHGDFVLFLTERPASLGTIGPAAHPALAKVTVWSESLQVDSRCGGALPAPPGSPGQQSKAVAAL